MITKMEKQKRPWQFRNGAIVIFLTVILQLQNLKVASSFAIVRVIQHKRSRREFALLNLKPGSSTEDMSIPMKKSTSTKDKNRRSRGFLLQRYTGDSTPYQFPVRPIRLVRQWPENPPFSSSDFARIDAGTDGIFYALPRFLYHIDEPAVAALTQFYRNTIEHGSDILDICSSWVSHYPVEFPATMGRICGTGMSGFELRFNDQLTGGYEAVDLNASPKLPYPDESFDIITCVVSIDYLIYPIQVLKEVYRVLRPNGKVIISQSNRCFPTKAINMWLNMNDRQHLELINGYFQYAEGYQEPRQAFDITADVPDVRYRDPMYVVVAIKESG